MKARLGRPLQGRLPVSLLVENPPLSLGCGVAERSGGIGPATREHSGCSRNGVCPFVCHTRVASTSLNPRLRHRPVKCIWRSRHNLDPLGGCSDGSGRRGQESEYRRACSPGSGTSMCSPVIVPRMAAYCAADSSTGNAQAYVSRLRSLAFQELAWRSVHLPNSPRIRLRSNARPNAEDLPGTADLARTSFPCQDHSLAGSGATSRDITPIGAPVPRPPAVCEPWRRSRKRPWPAGLRQR